MNIKLFAHLPTKNIAFRKRDLAKLHRRFPQALSHSEAIELACKQELKGIKPANTRKRAWPSRAGRPDRLLAFDGAGRRKKQELWLQVTVRPAAWLLLHTLGEIIAQKTGSSFKRVSYALMLSMLSMLT